MLNFRSFLEYSDPFFLETILHHPQQWSYLNPETGKKWRHEDKYKQLARIVKDQSRMGVHPNRLWVTFSDVPRINITTKVKKDKNTPHGIFAYPVSYVLKKEGADYASDRAYMIVFKVKGNVIEVGRDDTKPKDKNLNALVNKDDFPSELDYRRISSKFYDLSYDTYDATKKKLYRDFSEILSDVSSHIAEAESDGRDLKKLTTIEGLAKSYTESGFATYLKDYYGGTIEGDNVIINKPYQYNDKVTVGTHPIQYMLDNDGDAAYYINDMKAKQIKVAKALEDEEFKTALSKMASQVQGRIDHKNKKATDTTRPIINKVAELAKEYGIDDIKPHIKRISANNTFHRGTQFVYLLLKDIAGEVANKTGRNRAIIWAGMLKKIGYTHVVDTKHSSVIHAGEPTQGVFMDTTQIEPVSVIFNKKNADPRMVPPGFPWTDADADQHWQSSVGQHSRTGLKTLKAGDAISSGVDKKNIVSVLSKRIEQVKNSAGSDFYGDEFQKKISILVKLTKQLKSSVDPNNFVQKDEAERTLKRLKSHVEVLKDKLLSNTKDKQISPAIQKYNDDLNSRFDMLDKVISEPGFKTGTVKKLDGFNIEDFVTDLLKNKGPLTADAVKKEFINYGIGNPYGMWGNVESLVSDGKISKKYSDLYGGYVYYLSGQKIPSVEDYAPYVIKALQNTYKTTEELEEILQDKVPADMLEPILSNMEYGVFSGDNQISKSKKASGEWAWHIAGHDVEGKETEIYKVAILNKLEEMQKKEATSAIPARNIIFYFKHNENADIKKILTKLIQDKTIHVEEGTFGKDEIGTLHITTNPVAESRPLYYTDVRDFIYNLFKNDDDNALGDDPIKTQEGMKTAQIANKIAYDYSVDSIRVQSILQYMIKHGELHIIEDHPENFWAKKVSIHKPKPVAATATPAVTPTVPAATTTPTPAAAPHPGTTPAASAHKVADAYGHDIKVGDTVKKVGEPTKVGTVTTLSAGNSVAINWEDGAYSGNYYYGTSLIVVKSAPAAPWHGLGAAPAAPKAAWAAPTPEEVKQTTSTKALGIFSGLPKVAKPLQYARVIRGLHTMLSFDNILNELEGVFGIKFNPSDREAIKNAYNEETNTINYYKARGHLKFPKGLSAEQAYSSQLEKFPNPPYVTMDADTNKAIDDLLVKHEDVAAVNLVKKATQFDTGAATGVVILKKLELHIEGKL